MMFDRYTDRARRSVILSQDLAREYGHTPVSEAHLLTALAVEGEGVAGQALAACGVNADMLRAVLATVLPPGSDVPAGPIPFSGPLAKVLEGALREALKLGCNYVGTEHLLLALITDSETLAISPCTRMLRMCGTSLAQVHGRVIRLLIGYRPPGPRPAAPEGQLPAPTMLDAWNIERLLSRLDAIGAKLGVEFPPDPPFPGT